MPEVIPDPLLPPCYLLFSRLELKNLNNLLLIPLCVARATRAGALPREAPATR